MNLDLSVIIPAYNTEECVGESIESVLRQKLDNYEIIVVDDGSTDATWNVIKKYEHDVPVITAIRQEHKRQGAARNAAMSFARGKYVAFLDSDDVIPQGVYARMLAQAKKYDSDMVAGIQASVVGRRNVVRVPVHKYDFEKIVPRAELKSMPRVIGDISACNRIIRHSLLEHHRIVFPEGTHGEDIEFMAKVYLACESFTILPEVVYLYRGRKGSETRRISTTFFAERVDIVSGLETMFVEKGLQYVYKELVSSELRKLVGQRLTRLLRMAPYDEQVEVLDKLATLADKLTGSDIDEYVYYQTRDRMRAHLLKSRMHDALLSVEIESDCCRFPMMVGGEAIPAEVCASVNQFVREESKRYPFGSRSRYARLIARFAWSFGALIDWLPKVHPYAILKYLLVAPLVMGRRKGSEASTWLIDERIAQGAEDNGYALFEYLSANVDSVDAYFILSSSASTYRQLKQKKNVVRCFSWKHAVLLWRADVLLSTDSFRSLAFPYEALPSLRRKTVNVFLQHGVTGNKKMSYTKSNYRYFTCITVSSEREKNAFVHRYGYSSDQVDVTGFARFDALGSPDANQRSGVVLVSPTWRRWLRWEDDIRVSKYYCRWSQFLKSDYLGSILERYQLSLVFVPHFSMRRFFEKENLVSSRIAIGGYGEPGLNELVRTADMLVTDYSSIMYDFFYQRKPVLGYMFDRKEWENQPPGPPDVDFDQDLPLEIFYDEQSVCRGIEERLQENTVIREGLRSRLDGLFTYRDGENRKRIVDMVYRSLEANEQEL